MHNWIFYKKILDYGTRNRKCNKFDLGYEKSSHDCWKNYTGSAKSMEADLGKDLLMLSSVLKETN